MARYHLTIPDRMDGVLRSLVEDCDLTPSQIFTQLLSRHSEQLRSQLALNCLVVSSDVQSCTELHTTAQNCTSLQNATHLGTSREAFESLEVHLETSEGFDFASMIANS